VRAIKAVSSLRLAELLPDVGIVGSFTYGFAQSVDSPQNAFWNLPNTLGAGLYLAFRQPLDIALRLARLNEARADERTLLARRREALRGIGLEIDRAFADLTEAKGRMEKSARAEKIARGWYNSVDQALQIGVVESRDLVDAARNYFELRLRHLQSIMDVNVATAALERAAGVE
jgi:outer membrane protein TolC